MPKWIDNKWLSKSNEINNTNTTISMSGRDENICKNGRQQRWRRLDWGFPLVDVDQTEVFFWWTLTRLRFSWSTSTRLRLFSHWGFQLVNVDQDVNQTEVFNWSTWTTLTFSTGRRQPGRRPDWGFLLVDGRRQADVLQTPKCQTYLEFKFYLLRERPQLASFRVFDLLTFFDFLKI